MSVQEIRAIAALAAIFALRMLGLFWIVPVFSIYAQHIPGGDNPFLVGLALGIYGLMQAIFYIPYGKASDRLGRKPVIAAGLLIFALGSAVAAAAPDIKWIIAGRALQGAGAISSALSAFVADLTAEHNRVKAMAMIGASIGVSFAFAIVTAPVLFDWIGMRGRFAAIGVLAIAALGVLRCGLPLKYPRHSFRRCAIQNYYDTISAYLYCMPRRLPCFSSRRVCSKRRVWPPPRTGKFIYP